MLDGVIHHQILPVLRLTKRCPSVFILAVLVIIDGERKGVTKYGRCELEAHLVIGEIAARPAIANERLSVRAGARRLGAHELGAVAEACVRHRYRTLPAVRR